MIGSLNLPGMKSAEGSDPAPKKKGGLKKLAPPPGSKKAQANT
jgi:hypothetical protein